MLKNHSSHRIEWPVLAVASCQASHTRSRLFEADLPPSAAVPGPLPFPAMGKNRQSSQVSFRSVDFAGNSADHFPLRKSHEDAHAPQAAPDRFGAKHRVCEHIGRVVLAMALKGCSQALQNSFGIARAGAAKLERRLVARQARASLRF
jgi:hypothetical protein